MYGTYCRLRVHVSASNREVIKAASKKIKKHHRFAREVREARHKFYREMLAYHKDAQETYRAVVTGKF